jgi:hypothetical protein
LGYTVTGFTSERLSPATRPEFADVRSHSIWQEVNTWVALLYISISAWVDRRMVATVRGKTNSIYKLRLLK